MVFESAQQILYLITLIAAGFTALAGLSVVHRFTLKKTALSYSNVFVFIFALLAFGYSCFALAELTWYLIFEVFDQFPSVSMPDFYWVIGSVSLLIAFTTFSLYMFKQHKSLGKGSLFLFLGGAVFAGILYFALSGTVVDLSKGKGHLFLGYFYPIASALILVASASVYLFFEKVEHFGKFLMYLLFANLAFFIGDVLYTYYSFKSVYGITGVLSDVL